MNTRFQSWSFEILSDNRSLMEIDRAFLWHEILGPLVSAKMGVHLITDSLSDSGHLDQNLQETVNLISQKIDLSLKHINLFRTLYEKENLE